MWNFYPRPPRGGRPYAFDIGIINTVISIHALREEGDCRRWAASSGRCDFYPRPPRGGRPVYGRCCTAQVRYFYPRPPRGGRLTVVASLVAWWEFLSTPSARRATNQLPSGLLLRLISIHALREEGDCFAWLSDNHMYDFYPRPPRGGRQISQRQEQNQTNFYPRPPRGGRHLHRVALFQAHEISIHALREEGDHDRFRLWSA